MANHAVLTIDGKKSDLKHFSYSLSRYTEENGKPSTRVRSVMLNFVKDTIYDKGSATTWMSDPDKGKDGEVVIYADEAKKNALKTIKWTNGYICAYEENFNLDAGSSNTVESFSITCETVDIDGAKFDFLWPESHA
ncbi:MAG: hypothetical protein H6577_13755 [Lewinellaceae bacterium]|nr:hypothetical protein [Saprospiraceae bacterium]MCB9339191.1 hypothetical protein [Lewinellaceae bacterium]